MHTDCRCRIPSPRPPVDERGLLTSLTFYLSASDRVKVLRALRTMGERDRSGALLRLVESRGGRS
ncbi:MAG: hypothetical protein ACNA8P_12415 [Phycisphaerales bacterium]